MGALANATGIVGVVVRRLNAFNARHPWNHNDHFHGWILRHLPAHHGSALDVGCGRGLLVERLAPRFEHVLGIDVDAAMVSAAAERCRAMATVQIRHEGFDQVPEIATGHGFDLVTMAASLHHMDLAEALLHAVRLLAPEGRLLVVGLSRPATRVDTAWDVVSGLLNPMVGLVKHPRRAVGPEAEPQVPLRDPADSFDEIRATARQLLPGARVRRRLFFRYTLEWTKPS